MKKIVSVLVIIALIFALPPLSGAAAFDNSIDFENGLRLLYVANVVSSYDFDDASLVSNVSRADFLLYASKLIKTEEQPIEEEKYFTDLKGHWAEKIAARFVKMGVISVSDDRLFRPNDNITLAEASKIIVSLLGYDALARVNGGYPSGYLLMTARLGIFANGTGENLTLAEVLYALANALEAPCYAVDSIKNDSTVYKQDDENTLLKIYHGLEPDTGYVTSFANMSLDGTVSYGDYMYIGKEKYSCSDIKNADAFLGKYVKVYYSKSGDMRTAKLVCTLSDDTSVEINANDIDSFDSNYSLSYYKDGGDKKYTKKLERSIRVLYNGARKDEGISDMFRNLKNGSVRLIDADENGVYEYAVVKDYSDFVTGYADSANLVVYDKSGKTQYELENFERYGIFDVSHNALSLASVKENTVLSVAASEDNKTYIEIIVSNAVVSGSVSEVSQADDGIYVTIDEKEYKMSEECSMKDGIYAGFNGTFYLNSFGDIAYFKLNPTGDFRYGYVTHGEISEDVRSRVDIEIFDDMGALKTRSIEDNIIIDGEKYKNAEDVLTLEWAKNKVIMPQMIRFKTDSEGKITYIDTVLKNASYESGKDALIETVPVDDSLSSSGMQRIFYCTSSSSRIGTNVIFNTNTKLFFVPEYDDIKNENYKEADFSLGAFSDMVVDSGVNAKGYRADGGSVYEDVVVCFGRGAGEAHDDNTNVFVLKGTKKASDQDGFVYTKIYGLRGGGETSFFIADSYAAKFESLNLSEGDLLSLQTDNEGKVSDIILLYDFSQGGDPYTQAGSRWYDKNRYVNNYSAFSQKFSMSFMYAAYKSGNVVKGIYNIGGDAYDSDEAFDVSAVKIIVIDSERTKGNKVYTGGVQDIRCALTAGGENSSKIFAHYRYITLKDVVVYK